MPRAVILASRPTGVVQAENFEIVDQPYQPLQSGEIRVINEYLSVEPAMRGWIADTHNYSGSIPLGSVMRAIGVGTVVESRDSTYHEGERLCGWFGWQHEAVVKADAVIRRVARDDLSPSLALGILGINGVTAFLALTGIGNPQPGETVVVSTAAGAVGSAVGQIATILGARTLGITSGPVKVRQCIDLFKYQNALDYKTSDFKDRIAEICRQGIDVYYDNTSGRITDSVLPHLAVGSRIIVCGTASIPQWAPWPQGPRVERHLLVKRARMEGFVIFDHMEWQSAIDQLSAWIRQGKLQYVEEFLDGIESCPDAIAGLYRGENHGKRIIRLS
jgi:NADPH-dependent curcumin reductase